MQSVRGYWGSVCEAISSRALLGVDPSDRIRGLEVFVVWTFVAFQHLLTCD